jgi:cytochrome c553
VHHKDGNHLNNPPDGSNWENLCVYCHEDEHTRELLGKYLSEGKE